MSSVVSILKFCKACLVETERTAKGECKACVKVYRAAYRQANKEALKAYRRDYYLANIEKEKAYKTAYHAENREKTKQRLMANPAQRERNIELNEAWKAANQEKLIKQRDTYRRANLEAFRVYAQNRLARKRANGGVLSKDLAQKLLKLQRGLCPCCKQPLGDDFHLDHVMPLARGGPNTDDNIQLLHSRCNIQKRDLHPVDFMQKKGFLL